MDGKFFAMYLKFKAMIFFFGLNNTNSVFLILRLKLFVFSQFESQISQTERLDKPLFISFDKICSEECDCIMIVVC